MAYKELIKNFDKIRDYMREFYVYGFKSRDEYNKKSGRSYDDERRRLESWFEDYIGFHQTSDGKNVFISIDSRKTHHNPLYKAWKAKSFTDGDISLHFILFDILYDENISLTAGQITDIADRDYLSEFDGSRTFDESTVRKKLKEYAALGLVTSEKLGKKVLYKRTESLHCHRRDALNFYSEIAPCGVIGSFLLDRTGEQSNIFTFKHHYINQTTDSEILLKAFLAMKNKNEISLTSISRKGRKNLYTHLVPLNVFISVQSGRQYLMVYTRRTKRIKAFRLDYILNIEESDTAKDYEILRETLKKVQKNMWGVSTEGGSGRMEHVRFTIHFDQYEDYIFNRLEREKRCGTVRRIDETTAEFSADVFDSSELVPWIRTFICRITDIYFSNPVLQRQFLSDLNEMYEMYGINDKGGEQT